jgi:hypothetical protein
MIVIQNKDYVWISLYCIISFLRLNPGSTIEVTVDDATYNLAKQLYKCIDRKRICIIVENNNGLPALWSKAKLIVSLQNSNYIFMDADLRWHKPLPNLPTSGITVLSEEFDLAKRTNYRNLMTANKWVDIEKVFMLNTSFVYLNKISFAVDFSIVLNLIKQFENVFDKSFGFNPEENIKRLSEQIVLSYLLRKKEVHSLDLIINSRNDLGVESTYFGATGHRFGR